MPDQVTQGEKTKRPMLLKGETWFPQNNEFVAPREIIRSLSNLIRYRTVPNYGAGIPVWRDCSPTAMRAWIKKWGCKI